MADNFSLFAFNNNAQIQLCHWGRMEEWKNGVVIIINNNNNNNIFILL